MAVKEIVKVPDKVLNTKATEVNKFDDELKKLVQDLLETLEAAVNPKGAGLAAPQIGVLKRVCIAKRFITDPNDPDKEIESSFILINPKILSFSEVTGLGWEGCLSIPDTYGQVVRAKRIKVEAYDINGLRFSLKAEGFFARVIQHEVDHLDGILFTSKVVGKTLSEAELDKLNEEK